MRPFDYIHFTPFINKETNGCMRVRLMVLSHIKEGANNSKSARNLNISRRTVNDWVKKYYAHGIYGLKGKHHSIRLHA